MTTGSDPRPRVLIVEEDAELAFATMEACAAAGLEPKLCLGPGLSSTCPGLTGEACPRTDGIEATLISVTSGMQRRVAPSCVGGAVVLAGDRPLVGAPTKAILQPDRCVSYPYEPAEAASLLASLVPDAAAV